MPIKIKLHSVTAPITNSSTTIYTYSENSPKACEEMIDAFFEAFSIPMKCSDVFSLVLLLDSTEHYGYWLERSDNEIDGDVNDFISKVESGEVQKPQWMFECERDMERAEYSCGTTLNIISKKPEHEALAAKIAAFLYSTRAEESSC